ncbi:serine hydrolase family protein [Kribbella antibiotica]|uniref:Serine hydrolase family protein n=1 Tax=Kribbella antibiotica TaxID=190195 RepID=A0A4R4ZS34_9ACTN|nr:alpha/beta hydrolase [Kribbella antibiotica]TDD60749.1 serine hydrolase family protein [Kribbella antibiotica]
MHYIIVPGWNGSDSAHWQSIWEAGWLPGATRIAPASWTHPERDDWVDAIERSVRKCDGDEVVFVAHSLGCYAVAHWLAATASSDPVRGAFLVAPPDQHAETFPGELLSTFLDSEPMAASVPAVLVASDNDPYCSIDAAARIADDWQLPLVATGELGHINSESNLADWPLGQRLLTSFVAGLGRR